MESVKQQQKVTKIQRVFKVGDRMVTDPNPAWHPEQVKMFLMGQYPQVSNSVVEEPVFSKHDSQPVFVYEFKTKYGTNG